MVLSLKKQDLITLLFPPNIMDEPVPNIMDEPILKPQSFVKKLTKKAEDITEYGKKKTLDLIDWVMEKIQPPKRIIDRAFETITN